VETRSLGSSSEMALMELLMGREKIHKGTVGIEPATVRPLWGQLLGRIRFLKDRSPLLGLELPN
jgi:hypothetical protein